MYKLLIVDDEEIEREGMANFIEWKKFDIDMIGTAQNGEEGIEKIKILKPDIVMTDIKMPVMDGIEMICQIRKMKLNSEFIVLSGYGDYEFTSRAMEEGVRHYLLKPCDEEQIGKVIDKIKRDIEKKKQIEKVSFNAEKLFPKAKEQIFRELLINEKRIIKEYKPLLEDTLKEKTKGFIVTFAVDRDIDYLEQFITGNMLEELLGKDKVYLSTVIQKKIVFFVDESGRESLEKAIGIICTELSKLHRIPVMAAVSDCGEEDKISEMYQQTCGFLKVGVAEKRKGFICRKTFRQDMDYTGNLLNYKVIQNTGDLTELLFEVHLLFVKMDLNQYSMQKKLETLQWILRVLYETDPKKIGMKDCIDQDNMEREIVDILILQKNLKLEDDRMKDILVAVFQNIDKPELNIKYLATEILYMNEDYLSRLFLRKRKEKFSEYLQRQRILMAQRIFSYAPDSKISQVAEFVGYSPDGQYFSKIFRKITGCTPTEYKIKKNNE